jgi:glucose/arabinose dehydrogenase
MIRNLLCVIILLLITETSINAQITLQNAFPNLSFNGAVFLTHADDSTDRIFVVEQDGFIKVFANAQSASDAKIYLDIDDRVASGGEMGLLGLAFHPDYENNGYFFVNYTANNPRRTIISRFQVTSNPDSADENSEFQLLVFDQPESNHNGGWVGFGPNDGYLYIAMGDGGSDGANSQNLTNLLGKILRIDVDGGTPYSIPPTNPFFDSTIAQIKKEIYAWGLRNPWRCSFDHITGWLWAGDVGQYDWEEIDVIENGKNYGWNVLEGFHCYSPPFGCDTTGKILPIWEYSHNPECSITGGYVYRGINTPELEGKYIYGDFCSRKIWFLEYDGITPPTNQLIVSAPAAITSFGVDQNYEIFIVVSDGGQGNIYRFTPTVTSGEIESRPDYYYLEQNYPNPFNPSTMISYYLPEDSEVSFKVYDAVGKEIENLMMATQSKGYYNRTWIAEKFSSGVYFIKMDAISLSSNKAFSNVIKALFLK